MALKYNFLGKDKLVKGHTYPIKRSELDAALEAAGVTELKYVSYNCYAKEDLEKHLILSADLFGEAQIPGTIIKQTPDIGVYSMPANKSQEVKELLQKHDVLNMLANWLRNLESAENVRRDQSQKFAVYFHSGALEIQATK